jgi:hypothetical protein
MNKYFTSQGMGGQSPEAKVIGEKIADNRKNFEGYDTKNLFNAVTAGGIGAIKGKSQNFLENIGGGLEAGFGQYIKGQERKEDLMNKLRTGEIDLAKLNSTERSNLFRNITSAINADETAKSRLEGVKHNTKMREIEAGKREDDRKLGQQQKDETQIREWTKIFLGSGNTNPSSDQIAAARKQAEDYVRNTKVIKIPS